MRRIKLGLSEIAIIQTVVASYPAKTRSSYPSPDQKWRADVVVYNECTQTMADTNSYEVLKLIDLSNGSEKIIENELINCGGIGASGLDGLFWSANSRYFYYTDAAVGVPDGGCLNWQRPITRLDVTTLKTDDRTGYVSPNHEQIAGWGASEIVVWDINSDKTTHLPAAGTEGSIISLTWSPDGQAIAYLQMVTDPSSPCPPVGKTSLVRVDLSSLQQEVVLVAESPG